MCLTHPVHADHEAEVARSARRHPGECVLEHRRLAGGDIEQLRGPQEGVGSRLPGDVLFAHRHAVDPLLHEPGETGHLEHVAGVGAGRHHRHTETRVGDGLEVAA